jgi:hypothetical protein
MRVTSACEGILPRGVTLRFVAGRIALVLVDVKTMEQEEAEGIE